MCAAGKANPIKVNNPATIQAAKQGECEEKHLLILATRQAYTSELVDTRSNPC
jgi:hypothetical protein